MFVNNAGGFVLCLKFIVKYFLEDILETTIIFLQNGVLGGKVQGPFFTQGHIEAAACKTHNTFVGIVHGHGHTISFEIEYFKGLGFATSFRSKGHGELSFAFDDRIRSPVLIAKSMTTHDNRSSPVAHQAGYIADHDRLPENGSVEDIPDRAIWTFPHLFQTEFLHPGFVRSDGGTLDTHPIFFNGIGCIYGHLIIGLITVFDTQVIIFDIHLDIRQDQLVFNEFPDNPGHFIAIQLYDRVRNFDLLCHTSLVWVYIENLIVIRQHKLTILSHVTNVIVP